jgi:hypothetical protein
MQFDFIIYEWTMVNEKNFQTLAAKHMEKTFEILIEKPGQPEIFDTVTK